MDALGDVTCAVFENGHITMIVDLFSMSKMDALVDTILLAVGDQKQVFWILWNLQLNTKLFFPHILLFFLISYSLVSLASAKSNKIKKWQ